MDYFWTFGWSSLSDVPIAWYFGVLVVENAGDRLWDDRVGGLAGTNAFLIIPGNLHVDTKSFHMSLVYLHFVFVERL